MKYWLIGAVLVVVLLGWAGFAVYGRMAPADPNESIPTTVVQRGDVRFSVVAKGSLQGKSTRILTVPMAAKGELIVTSLRQQGELVHDGDVVAEFDATELDFDLREATADLEEANERLKQARAEALAKDEEARYALAKAGSDVGLAELECRRNPLLASIVAQQNDLALEAARDRLTQLQTDLASRQAAAQAGVAIQQAAVSKAQVKADIARTAIESMTLRAPADGYVSILENRNSSGIMFTGMELPIFQLGDSVRPGVPLMQIPNLEDWQVSAQIGELDRGHLAVGQEAEISIVATPGKVFRGRITNIGSTTGPPWNRRFDCSISIDEPSAELRPGMSAMIEIVTAELADVLWLPSQAVFDRGGQPFVYLRGPNGFAPLDVTLARSGGARVAVEGIEQGSVVALSDPTQLVGGEAGTNAVEALPGQ
jgi:multidrug efflux pump subunit AcrA (membrane-fusion protein)